MIFRKAGIFAVVVLVLAVAAALVIDGFGLGSSFFAWASVWSITPVLATLIMQLVVTRDGRTKEGWRTLGLHRLGLRVWWIAFFGTLAVTVVAYAAVWLTPLASVTIPPQGVLPIVGSFLLQPPILATTFLLCEEIGFRGYLLPKLLPLGRKRALLLSGLVFATWPHAAGLSDFATADREPGHQPALVLRRRGCRHVLLRLPAARFRQFVARLDRPRDTQQCLGHDHRFTVTSAPLLVNGYLVGEFGILITVGAAIAAALVSRLVPHDVEDRDSGTQAHVSIGASRTTTSSKPIRTDTGVDRTHVSG